MACLTGTHIFVMILLLLLTCSALALAEGVVIDVSSTPASLPPVRHDYSIFRNAAPRTAVVVGGGPVGLAAALTLSNPPHSLNVTVLEQSTIDSSVSKYDPTRAYLVS
jgi:pyruvate/2-oxoglutarate dehydrogenase complex dihydrolipoamide dehydrogenase (E3) component